MRPSSTRALPRRDGRGCVSRWFVGCAQCVLSCGCGDTKDTIALPRAETEAFVVECSGAEAPSSGALALYAFDGDEGGTRVTDSVGRHDATVLLGTTSTVDGPDGCGPAFAFGREARYFVIEDSPDWDLDVGSLDLWLWLPASSSEHVGILSRDAVDRERPGHLSLFVDREGRALVRVQPTEDDRHHLDDAVACSETALPRQRWVHLAVNFGPPEVELYVGGALQAGVGRSAIGDAWECGQRRPWGIAGNDLPWVVGRSALRGGEPFEALEFPMFDGAVDQLRISGVRRDFASQRVSR